MSALDNNRQIYRIDQWAERYFSIDAEGHICHQASGYSLRGIAQTLQRDGYDLPVLVRFNDILRDRVERLYQAFCHALTQREMAPHYTPIYPIKVNQQASVVEALLKADAPLGLEAGSKAELAAVIASAPAGATIICNGYKDREYIRMALIAKHMGHACYLVIEQSSELTLVNEVSRQLDIAPLLGLRIRLATLGTGRWQNSGGEGGKFGLTAAEAYRLIEDLKQSSQLECLKLLHVHMGSQIAELSAIEQGVREICQFYADLCALGAPLDTLDIGGGLGVDYEGSANHSEFSMGYTLSGYAEAVVATVHGAMQSARLPMPQLFSESGRALTAHHAVLLTEVGDIESPFNSRNTVELSDVDRQYAPLSTLLSAHHQCQANDYDAALFETADKAVQQVFRDYAQGHCSLRQRIAAEECYYALCRTLDQREREAAEKYLPDDVRQALHRKLASKFFCNLSLFQSLPDVWGIDQVFPIVPLQRLDEATTEYAVIHDLTCDSDGQIKRYACTNEFAHTLPVHAVRDDEHYLLGLFLVGAYQEILGDMHNLFGDTHAVNVEAHDQGLDIVNMEVGDRADQLLEYVHYDLQHMQQRYRDKLDGLPQADEHLACLMRNLHHYTYLNRR